MAELLDSARLRLAKYSKAYKARLVESGSVLVEHLHGLSVPAGTLLTGSKQACTENCKACYFVRPSVETTAKIPAPCQLVHHKIVGRTRTITIACTYAIAYPHGLDMLGETQSRDL